MSTSSRTLQMFTKEETVTPCLLFILQPIYLHNLSPHMSSQPITLSIYQRLLYLPTNQIAHQGFWIFNWLTLPLDSEDGFRIGCRNVSHKQQSLILRTPLTQMIFFNQGTFLLLEHFCLLSKPHFAKLSGSRQRFISNEKLSLKDSVFSTYYFFWLKIVKFSTRLK